VFLAQNQHLLDPVDLALLVDATRTMHHLFEESLPAVYLECEENVMLLRLAQRARKSEHNMTYVADARL
jgi:hypothetical protein